MTLTTLQLSESRRTVALRQAGEGEPLLLIHGVGMQSCAWAPQKKALQKNWRVIAVDMPGHGGSDPLPEDSDLSDFVRWCHDLVKTLGAGPVNLVGHSMGALIAGGFAAEHPKLTRRVALLNGVYRRNPEARAAVISRAAEIRAGTIDMQIPLDRWFGNTPAEVRARTCVAAWLGSVEPGGYATAYSAFAKGDAVYAGALSGIDCPFLALTGEGDPNSTPEMSARMAAVVQDGQCAVIPGHRHMINLTAPDAVNEYLVEWLNRPLRQKEMQ
ncbi:alpha/beta hydrolase [uncultured Roseobacter sp.]|uniref:alpha/beta fold hydrolase n=1 Tax=uncultured Roseobacter sp. TaxID=114847 RepID=UPI0026266021|nr:alpha/beta hydrolase [uncultured Roseobacter sp.]